MSTHSELWFKDINTSSADRQLFCFPYAGGGVAAFRDWGANLNPLVNVKVLQLPGREHRINELPLKNLSNMVPQIVDAILPLLKREFSFFGHSMGALFGFEVARYLERHYDISPNRLFVSAHSAPHLTKHSKRVSMMSDADFLSTLQSINGTPEEVLRNSEIMNFLLPVLRADFEICESYRYVAGPLLSVPITCYGGITDDTVTINDLNEWSTYTQSNFNIKFFNGGHFFLKESRGELLDDISAYLVSDEGHTS